MIQKRGGEGKIRERIEREEELEWSEEKGEEKNEAAVMGEQKKGKQG